MTSAASSSHALITALSDVEKTWLNHLLILLGMFIVLAGPMTSRALARACSLGLRLASAVHRAASRIIIDRLAEVALVTTLTLLGSIACFSDLIACFSDLAAWMVKLILTRSLQAE